MNADLSIVELILNASWPVKVVMLVLVFASVASWAIIIEKSRLLKKVTNSADTFEASFWSGIDLRKFYAQLSNRSKPAFGMEAVFQAGYREYARLSEESGVSPNEFVESVRRAMNVSQMREIDRLEQNLVHLATVGSTSPYVGLLGTVWGIMNSFIALGAVQSATISMVAPGIVEALIATAMGLFAAIPAVIAYNRYADQVDRLVVRYDTFMEELIAILARSVTRRARAASAPGTAGVKQGAQV
jgi:biopolymer transport protein TolQ